MTNHGDEDLKYNLRLENFANIAMVSGSLDGMYYPDNVKLIEFMIELANEFESDVWRPLIQAGREVDYWITIDEFAERKLREKEGQWRQENGKENDR